MSLIEYAQARMQARFGKRAGDGRWRELDGIRDLHEIDARLRESLGAQVREVARWMPQRWRPALLWLLELPELPAIAHRLAGGEPPAWSSAAPAPQGPAEGLRPGAVRAAWIAEWQRRWPPGERESCASLRRMLAAVLSHIERFARGGVGDAWSARAALEGELRRLFRRFSLRPEAAFAYLGLVALDLERLRAQLVARALRGEVPAA